MPGHDEIEKMRGVASAVDRRQLFRSIVPNIHHFTGLTSRFVPNLLLSLDIRPRYVFLLPKKPGSQPRSGLLKIEVSQPANLLDDFGGLVMATLGICSRDGIPQDHGRSGLKGEREI